MHTSDTVAFSSDYSPLGLLLNAYDQAINACRERNTARAYRTIVTLREAHPCDSPSAAGIDGLYAYCERAILSGDFLGAVRTLEQLRSAWQKADRITNEPPEAAALSGSFRPLTLLADRRPADGPDAAPSR